MLEFSRNLRIFLADNNIKKQEFAADVGVSATTVSTWLHCNLDKLQRKNAIKINAYTRNIITMEMMGF